MGILAIGAKEISDEHQLPARLPLDRYPGWRP
jgi:hypothetical protein